MRVKNASNKVKLEELLKKIQEIKRIPQGKISLLAEYETENYIAECKSNNNVSDDLLKRVRNVYERALKDPATLLNVPKPFIIANSAGTMAETMYRVEAKLNVLLSNDAELLGEQKGRLPTEVLREFDKAVRLEVENLKAVQRMVEEQG